jgi:hypothetical protein
MMEKNLEKQFGCNGLPLMMDKEMVSDVIKLMRVYSL